MKLIIKQLGQIRNTEIDLTKTFYLFTGYYTIHISKVIYSTLNVENIESFSKQLDEKKFRYNKVFNKYLYIYFLMNEYVSYLKNHKLAFFEDIDFDIMLDDSYVEKAVTFIEKDVDVVLILKSLLNVSDFNIPLPTIIEDEIYREFILKEAKWNPKYKSNFLFLDDIEHYLHPEEQVEVMNNILNNYIKSYNRLLITTHSPIITAYLNNYLLELHIKSLKGELCENGLQLKDFIVYNIDKKCSLKEYEFEDTGIYFQDFEEVERKIRYAHQDLLETHRKLLKTIK